MPGIRAPGPHRTFSSSLPLSLGFLAKTYLQMLTTTCQKPGSISFEGCRGLQDCHARQLCSRFADALSSAALHSSPHLALHNPLYGYIS